MSLNVNLGEKSYDIIIEQGALEKAEQYLSLNRRVMIVTDDLVPKQYAETIARQCKNPVICTITHGETHKNFASLEQILMQMLENGFTRKDCVVAVGGGICGDVAGYAAASYMRGVDFYNIPTTVLSQVDSSVGGKTAINLGTIKNVVGAFYQPKKVLIDINVLKTLPKRHISAGLAEAVKMAATFDAELFELLETCNIDENLELIIEKSLRIKANVVEQDEKESGLRKVLNFGHTIGHGMESQCLDGSLYHGECVAMGMLPMCTEEVRNRLISVLNKLNLPTSCNLNLDLACDAVMHDKKAETDGISIVKCEKIGTFKMEKADKTAIRELAKIVIKE